MSQAQKMAQLVLQTRDALDHKAFAQAVREYFNGLLLAEELAALYMKFVVEA